jgi:hypothetical protein
MTALGYCPWFEVRCNILAMTNRAQVLGLIALIHGLHLKGSLTPLGRLPNACFASRS